MQTVILQILTLQSISQIVIFLIEVTRIALEVQQLVATICVLYKQMLKSIQR